MNDHLCNWGRRVFLLGVVGLLWTHAGMPFASSGAATLPYLSVVGPVPLRFQAVLPPGAAAAWKAMMAAKAPLIPLLPTNVPAPAVVVPPPATNVITQAGPPSAPVDSAPAEQSDAAPHSSGDTFDPGSSQAWADLFKPGAAGKGFGARPEQPRFVPPAPKQVGPDGHSK